MAGKKKAKKAENATPVKESSYTTVQLENALNALRENPKRGIRLIGTEFGVPESTIRFNLKKEKARINVKIAHAFGKTRRRLLTEAEEDLIIKYIKDCCKRALPVTKGNVMDFLS